MSNPDDSHFWIATGYKDSGFIQFPHMADIISIMLQRYAETYAIHTTWGKDVYIEKLIPDALAKLAVKALS